MDSVMALFWSRSNMQFAVDKTDTLLNTQAVETGLHNIRLTVQTVSSPNIIHAIKSRGGRGTTFNSHKTYAEMKRILIKWILKKYEGRDNSSGSGQRQLVNSYENSNEPLGSTKGRESLN
jgi:hypothetical protein